MRSRQLTLLSPSRVQALRFLHQSLLLHRLLHSFEITKPSWLSCSNAARACHHASDAMALKWRCGRLTGSRTTSVNDAVRVPVAVQLATVASSINKSSVVERAQHEATRQTRSKQRTSRACACETVNSVNGFERRAYPTCIIIWLFQSLRRRTMVMVPRLACIIT